jgi:hypothetical protein
MMRIFKPKNPMTSGYENRRPENAEITMSIP